MNWRDERYVRLYTRDTPDWLCLSFLAQGLFCLILRKVDRAGVLDLGKVGRRGVFVAIGHAHQAAMLEEPLEELIADGCIEVAGDHLVVRNFMEAQEAEASDKARAKKHREKRRDLARATAVTLTPEPTNPVSPESRGVSDRHDTPEPRDAHVTKRDDGITGRVATVTPSRAVPPVPSNPPKKKKRSGIGGNSDDARWPLVAAVLAALWERKVDALWPAEEETTDRLERAIGALPLPEAIDRLAASLEADPAHPWLGWHLPSLRPAKPKPRPDADYGSGRPWYQHLTDDEARAFCRERHEIAPHLDDAPIGIVGPERELAGLHDKWRAIVEGRL